MRSLSVATFLLTVLATADAVCERNYDLLGCYEERNPQNMLFNNRHAINWNDIVGYMNDLACECAKQAKAGGYAGFALHYYGECYGKTNAEIQEIQTNGGHQQHLCVGDQTYDKCDTSAHDHCTGGSWAEGVYAFKTAAAPVDGGFSAWQPWSACDKDCGSGLKHRERNCDSPAPSGSGKDCSELGAYSESSSCKIRDCPVDGNYSTWSEFGACSQTCGTGVQTRTRACNNPAPAHGGSDCSSLGTASEQSSCYVANCPGCYSELTASSGSIQSPGYPSEYAPNIDCTTRITVAPGRRVFLQFTAFSLETDYDYLVITDGSSTTRYTGTTIPSAVTSTTNQLTIKFQTDHIVQKTGFNANYYTV